MTKAAKSVRSQGIVSDIAKQSAANTRRRKHHLDLEQFLYMLSMLEEQSSVCRPHTVLVDRSNKQLPRSSAASVAGVAAVA
eukprot:CAMPEP_0177523098 /NCGR_PEP_ID=MMETSP0369-20130122/49193_1 /TAXON_ID=447022 ORGANISM="Scrippsiella hangoei-like, Strain SHHI-4" /NCGR_SAMPLE_ID=MMETSP0369 /ASSEMBLY_ACC=CAM_ASM_000364 /LENGTH=80 /DNA_ID=CAMNT_0019002881 /DNA_START=20 /DNA_END=259 /DNA_ORIENTATION=+